MWARRSARPPGSRPRREHRPTGVPAARERVLGRFLSVRSLLDYLALIREVLSSGS